MWERFLTEVPSFKPSLLSIQIFFFWIEPICSTTQWIQNSKKIYIKNGFNGNLIQKIMPYSSEFVLSAKIMII